MITLSDFSLDLQGRRFKDVLSDTRISFQQIIDFFNQDYIIKRMEDSEIHHDRPALAGVVKEFESLAIVKKFLSENDAHTTFRFRQAIGVLVKLHMESRGWKTRGIKGSLGTRGSEKNKTTSTGAYINKHGLAKYFTRAERYKRQE